MKSLNETLMDELWKMDLRERHKIKTKYGNQPEYAMNTESYLKEKANFKNRGTATTLKNSR